MFHSQTYSAHFLVFVIMMYPIIIPVSEESSIPFYFILLPLSCVFIKNIRILVFDLCIVSAALTPLCLLQMYLGPGFLSSTKTLVGTIMISFNLAILWNHLKSIDEDSVFHIKYYLEKYTFAILALVILQNIAHAAAGINLLTSARFSASYSHYFLPIPRYAAWFPEPSSLGIALAPLVFFLVVYPTEFVAFFGKKLMWSIMLILFISPSASMIVMVLLFVLFSLFRKAMMGNLSIIYAMAMPLLLFISSLSIEVSSRLSGVYGYFLSGNIETENISVLMIIKGYEISLYTLGSYFFGVGALNFASVNEFSSISGMSDLLFDLNQHNGTSILFKGVTEFGWLFILFSLGIIYNLLKSLSYNATYSFIIYQSLLASVIASFIRGGSYYDGAVMIGLAISLFQIRGRWIQVLKAAPNNLTKNSKG